MRNGDVSEVLGMRQQWLTTRLNSRPVGLPESSPCCSESSTSKDSSVPFAVVDIVVDDLETESGADGAAPKTTSAARYEDGRSIMRH